MSDTGLVARPHHRPMTPPTPPFATRGSASSGPRAHRRSATSTPRVVRIDRAVPQRPGNPHLKRVKPTSVGLVEGTVERNRRPSPRGLRHDLATGTRDVPGYTPPQARRDEGGLPHRGPPGHPNIHPRASTSHPGVRPRRHPTLGEIHGRGVSCSGPNVEVATENSAPALHRVSPGFSTTARPRSRPPAHASRVTKTTLTAHPR